MSFSPSLRGRVRRLERALEVGEDVNIAQLLRQARMRRETMSQAERDAEDAAKVAEARAALALPDNLAGFTRRLYCARIRVFDLKVPAE